MADITATASAISPYMVEECQIRSRTAAVAFTAGQPVYYDSNGKANIADADAASPAFQFDGICLDTVGAGEMIRVLEEGWVAGFDLSGVAYNGNVYLSTSVGLLATAAPAAGAGYTVIVGRCDWRNDAGGTFTKVLRVNRHSRVEQSRSPAIVTVPLAGATIQGGVQAWQNPEAGNIDIIRAWVVVGTIATAAGTLSVGTTATSATTSSANLIDTLDVHTATGIFDNITDKGTNGKSRQQLATGKWVTFASASGNLTGLVGTLYIEYVVE